jgi:hypothetical protein
MPLPDRPEFDSVPPSPASVIATLVGLALVVGYVLWAR